MFIVLFVIQPGTRREINHETNPFKQTKLIFSQ